jgi:hypothetical protein
MTSFCILQHELSGRLFCVAMRRDDLQNFAEQQPLSPCGRVIDVLGHGSPRGFGQGRFGVCITGRPALIS